MNVMGFIRGYMSKNMSGEEFLKTVAKTVEGQLKQWDDNYEVMVMKLGNYEIVVKIKDLYYHVELSEQELETLRDKSLFSLDRKLWTELQDQGLPIIKGFGNYLDYVFIKSK